MCGGCIARFSDQTYREKLLHALKHPLDDVRLRAIIALGWRREEGTATDLADCALRHPLDIVGGMEIVRALNNFGLSAEARHALERLARDHPAHAIRAAAAEAWE